MLLGHLCRTIVKEQGTVGCITFGTAAYSAAFLSKITYGNSHNLERVMNFCRLGVCHVKHTRAM
jgi:hypothetical protein